MSRRSRYLVSSASRAARGLGPQEGARRPHLAGRAHEGACQRRRVAV